MQNWSTESEYIGQSLFYCHMSNLNSYTYNLMQAQEEEKYYKYIIQQYRNMSILIQIKEINVISITNPPGRKYTSKQSLHSSITCTNKIICWKEWRKLGLKPKS